MLYWVWCWMRYWVWFARERSMRCSSSESRARDGSSVRNWSGWFVGRCVGGVECGSLVSTAYARLGEDGSLSCSEWEHGSPGSRVGCFRLEDVWVSGPLGKD